MDGGLLPFRTAVWHPPVQPRRKQLLPALLHSLGASPFWYFRCCLLNKDGISMLWQYFSIKISLLPTTVPRAHHPPEMQAERMLRLPHSWVPWGLGLVTCGLPTLPSLPSKATQTHQELRAYLQPVTYLHNPAPLQILPLTLPDKANGATAYKRHIDNWCHLATALTLDDWVWLSSERTCSPWPLLIRSPLLPAVCTPGVPAGSPSSPCLHPEASPPRTLLPPAAVGPQQPGHQQSKFWTLPGGSSQLIAAATPRSMPRNQQTGHRLQPRFGLSTARIPQNPALWRVCGTQGEEVAVRVQGYPWALLAPTSLTQEPHPGPPTRASGRKRGEEQVQFPSEHSRNGVHFCGY